MKEKCKHTFFLLLLCFFINSCTEPYALQTNSYEEAIVIEAIITNELKNQEIKISKTYKFEENGPTFETGAQVYITDDLGHQYDFEEKEGIYVSATPFQAVSGREYRLSITTKDGKVYTSRNEKLTPVNEIASVTTNVTEKNKESGVQITVNSFDPSGESRFYRFEYEETYKIVAPNYNNLEIFVVGPQKVDFRLRTVNVKTCYSTKKSLDILLASTNDLTEDRVTYPIRFIADNNPIIAQRYSIMVRQYVQNLAAYTYFETLKKTAGSGSILSQNQPGFFYGNIKAMDNANEKVIGFFEVSSVSEKRIFFNFYDIFPREKLLPPYYYDCTEQILPFCFGNFGCKGNELIDALNHEALTLIGGDFGENPNSQFDDTYTMVPSPCGDCSTFSSILKPLFWID
ncbi:DUF4249 domain-containing protein [Flavobacterium sp. N3904]|uniref:DUF4249 domain-containing protein n=1 Tax=Flavobacterium sp. N3904 TaxID=2986835 RepID=UPI0022243581|nr:DUF4249 domain-containing protein [Flavobacterium sp. N3904]